MRQNSAIAPSYRGVRKLGHCGRNLVSRWWRSHWSHVRSHPRVLMPWSVSNLPCTWPKWPSQVLKNSSKWNNSDTGSWELVRARRNSKARKIWVEHQQDHLQQLKSNSSKWLWNLTMFLKDLFEGGKGYIIDYLHSTDKAMGFQEEADFSLPRRFSSFQLLASACLLLVEVPPSGNFCFVNTLFILDWNPHLLETLRLMGLFVTTAWPDLSWLIQIDEKNVDFVK